MNLLLIDDAPNFVNIAKNQLATCIDAEIHTATNFIDARNILAKFRPTMLISDFQMEGQDLNGASFLLETKQAYPDTACLLYTVSPESIANDQREQLNAFGIGVFDKSEDDFIDLLQTPGMEDSLDEIDGSNSDEL